MAIALGATVLVVILLLSICRVSNTECFEKEGFDPPRVKGLPSRNMHYKTQRLSTGHLTSENPLKLCVARTQDVYSPPHECV